MCIKLQMESAWETQHFDQPLKSILRKLTGDPFKVHCQGRNCMYAKTHMRTNLEANLCYEMPYNCFFPGASPPGAPIMVFLSLTSPWGLPPPTSAYSLILPRYAPDCEKLSLGLSKSSLGAQVFVCFHCAASHQVDNRATEKSCANVYNFCSHDSPADRFHWYAPPLF